MSQPHRFRRMMVVFGVGLLCGSVDAGAEGPTHRADFADNQRPKNWAVTVGSWEAADGKLVGRQVAADNHSAASRWQIPLSDGRIRFRLQFAGAGAVHVGFDPAVGQLPKTGHLYSLIITPTAAIIQKHRVKSDEKSKDVTLASAKYDDQKQQWLDIELSAIGDQVSAKIGTVAKLEATDPTFHVAKPTVVFRVIGDAAWFDDVEVTVLKPAPAAPKPPTTK